MIQNLLLCILCTLIVSVSCLSLESQMVPLFESFKIQFNRKYESHAEEAKRFANFRVNLRHAADLGAKNPLATFGVNVFSDLSAAEFKSYHNAEQYFKKQLPKRNTSNIIRFTERELKAIKSESGSSLDWRSKGAVTPVKNQAGCGGCWAFSTTGNIEGQWFIAHGELIPLSEQNLLSCDTTADGCNGGLMDPAFTFILHTQKGQMYTEASYPYVSASGVNPSCDYGPHKVGAVITGYKDVPQDEQEMGYVLAKHGPISVGVDAMVWQNYNGGIMTNCKGDEPTRMDHAVLIVGYGTSGNTPFWIIKNSWSATWGEEGYIRIERFKNTCDITGYPTTSTIDHNGPTPTRPPRPTTPPTPNGETFEQKICPDSTCASGCEVKSYPQHHCINDGNGGSLIGACTQGTFVQSTYHSSTNCTGPSTPQSSPINQCLRIGANFFFEVICHSLTAHVQGRVSDKKVIVARK